MTNTQTPHEANRTGNTIAVPWTSSAGGAATVEVAIKGFLYGAWTVPGTGDAAPTALYDLTIVAAAAGGQDLLGGNGADRSATAVEFASADPYPVPYNCDQIGNAVVTIAAAGDTNTGTVYLEVETR